MKIRNYTDISERLLALSHPSISVETVGTVKECPIYLARLRGGQNPSMTILLTAGVHGDEPAGIETVLRFLEQHATHRFDDFEFCLIPCINPTGYVNNTRKNYQGIDINRDFEADKTTEVRIIKDALGGQTFTCHIDFHEDWEGTGFYMYEGQRNGEYLGTEIVDRITATIGPIDVDGDSEDEAAISPGVYKMPERWGTVGLGPYILEFHAPHSIVCETPTSWDLDQRVAAHLVVLNVVLEHYRRSK